MDNFLLSRNRVFASMLLALKYQPSLKILSLSFKGNEIISDEELDRFGQMLMEKKELESIRISFCETENVNDKGFGKIVSAVTRLKNLRKVDFFIKDSMITEYSISDLAKQISKLRNLEHFCLQYNDEINGAAINSLIDRLTNDLELIEIGTDGTSPKRSSQNSNGGREKDTIMFRKI